MSAPRGLLVVIAPVLAVTAMTAAALSPGPAAAAVWPRSGGLLIAEVVTGGQSASDEYVEIANAGTTDQDLGGCELVYASASGATVTRKASFGDSQILAAGRHLLVANAAGIYGPLADATYSGGFAADGGSLAVRRIGGEVIDAVGWGTAANEFVEGSAAPAPPAGSSIERRPGGSAGNTQDSNDNGADFIVAPNPVPQSMMSDPLPGPSSSAEPGAEGTPGSADTTRPTVEPSVATATATSTSTPATEPTRAHTASASPTASAAPTPAPTAVASAVRTPAATPSPAEAPLVAIADARSGTLGLRVRVRGIVTAGLGAAGSSDLFVIEDSTGGVFVRPSASTPAQVVIGDEVEVAGSLAAPYGQLEIRETTTTTITSGGEDPSPARLELGEVGEESEARLVSVRGSVESVTLDDGRLTVVIGDGVTTVRAMADPASGIVRGDVACDDVVTASGIVGQRATATGRLDGYRIWLRRRSDLAVRAPIPTDPPQTRTPAVPTSTPAATDLASALGTRGRRVDVEATVTATAALLDIGGPTIVVDDGTAAVAVLIPANAAAPGVGMRVRVTGKIGSWQGGPTVIGASVTALGELRPIEPQTAGVALGPSLEWRLVRVYGRIQGVTHAGARSRVEFLVGGRTLVVLAEPAANVSVAATDVGRLLTVTGIVRRSTSDPSAFQLLARSPVDFCLGPAVARVGGGSTGSASPGGSGNAADPSTAPGIANAGGSSVVDVAGLGARIGETVTVAGLVIGTSHGTATLDDGTGEIRLGGVNATAVIDALEPGDAVEVTGVVTRDASGLLIEVDPASIVTAPAGSSPAAFPLANPLALVAADLSASPAPTPGARGAQWRVPAGTASPDPQVILWICVGLVVAAGLSFAAIAARTRAVRQKLWSLGMRLDLRARARPRR